jgi:hypothetical protein
MVRSSGVNTGFMAQLCHRGRSRTEAELSVPPRLAKGIKEDSQ